MSSSTNYIELLGNLCRSLKRSARRRLHATKCSAARFERGPRIPARFGLRPQILSHPCASAYRGGGLLKERTGLKRPPCIFALVGFVALLWSESTEQAWRQELQCIVVQMLP